MISPLVVPLAFVIGGTPDPVGGEAWYSDFRTYEEIDARLGELASGSDAATILDVGTSIEGRAIRGLSLSHADDRPTLLVTGTQHAREWISPMVTTCIAERLADDADADPLVAELLERLEVIVIPVVNPDGYVYSWDVDRLWRKNRRPGGGVDLNRNWGQMWGVGTQGAGPGSEIYPGSAAFSEPETMAVADLAQSRDVVAFVDYHSPVNLVLIPFAYTSDPSPHEDTQVEWAESMAAAITGVHGVEHGVSKPGIGNPSGGLAQDWFAVEHDAIAFTVELRSGGGGNGFILPAGEIELACEENWAGFLDLAARVSETYGVDDPGDDGGGETTGGSLDDTGGDVSGGEASDTDDPSPSEGTGANDGTDAPGDDSSGAGPGADPTFADPLETEGGCGCNHERPRPASWLGLVVTLLAVRRRRAR